MGYDSNIPLVDITSSIDPSRAPFVINSNLGRTTGGVYRFAAVNGEGSLKVSIDDPRGPFGGIRFSPFVPKIQIESIYGLRPTDVETFVSLNATASVIDGQYVCRTTGSVGGYAVIRSLRAVSCATGQGSTFRFGAMWPSGSAPLAFQMAGAFNVNDGLFFGYNGEDFGILHRVSGSNVIKELTLTSPATGSNQVTITLNGTSFQVPVTAGTLAHNAYQISTGSFTGWLASQNSSSVVFFNQTPGANSGSFNITLTGALTGTFTNIRSGTANDNDTGWVPQTSWNLDVLDGSASENNPSGMLLDPSKGNVYEIGMQYLSYGGIDFYVENPEDGKFIHVHRVKYANTNITPNMVNPSLKVGWVAASLGSTEELIVVSSAASGFSDGLPSPKRNPRAFSFTKDNIGTTETLVTSFRNRRVFGNNVNLSEVIPKRLNVSSNANAGKPNTVIKLYRSGSITGETNYSYINKSNSMVETNTSGTLTNGILLAAFVLAPDGSVSEDLVDLDIHIDPEDELTVTALATTNTVNVSLGLTWLED